jgi:hypothetical protein
MIEIFANNSISTLATSVATGTTTVTLASGTGGLFPNPTTGAQFFRFTMTSATTGATEITYCTARAGDVLTLLRAQESTTALAFTGGDYAIHEITAGMMVNNYSPAADQANVVRYSTETGSGNMFLVALNPPLPVGTYGDEIIFTASHGNTGASTLTVNSGTTYALTDISRSALKGGEIITGSVVRATWNGIGYSVIYSTLVLPVPVGTLVASNYVDITTYQDVTSSTFVDIAGLTSTVSIVKGPSKLVANCSVNLNFAGATWPAFVQLVISGGEYGGGTVLVSALGEGLTGESISMQITLCSRIELAQNVTYTVKAQVRNSTFSSAQNVRVNSSTSDTVATPGASSWLDLAAYKS